MARTALDLTTEELSLYRPGQVSDTLRASEKWEQAWEVARWRICYVNGLGQSR